MSKAHPPELKKSTPGLQPEGQGPKFSTHTGAIVVLGRYMEKVLTLKLNGNRKVTGTLRGFDPFMNLVVDDSVEETKTGEKRNIGMVVIRGNSVVLLESQERI